MPNTWKHLSGAFGALILGSLVTGLAMSLPGFLRNDPGAQDSVGPVASAAGNGAATATMRLKGQDLGAARDLSTAFRNVADLMRPSVVSINTVQTRVVRQVPRGVPRGFEDMFGGQAQRRESTGTGSGVIVRNDGYILTNNHVVEGADRLEVEFSDGAKVPGEIIGTDPQTDLAVVKVERSNLVAVPMGNSDEIQVGDWVVAIGSPFGLDQTVTAGIISGKNRIQGIIGDGDGFEDFLQTDAAINPGNSGGPLVNLNGELVGINTAIMSRSGSSAGIGFAIPVSMAGPVLDSIIKNGVVKRGFLGARLAAVNETTIQQYGLKVPSGVLIESVLEGMPASAAGIRDGDVVMSIDGRPMRSSSQMRNYVASRPPGASMNLTINRNGRQRDVRVDLKERTDEAMARFGSGEIMGAQLVPATEATAKKYGYQSLEGGLIIVGLEDDSVAEEGGMRVGDVIEAAAGIQLENVEQLQLLLREAKRLGRPLQLSIRRGNKRSLMVVQQ